MPSVTFSEYKDKDKFKQKEAQIKQEEEKNKLFEPMIESVNTYSTGVDYGGFAKDEVLRAAQFMLKIQPYDLNARKLDVTDSPVYYKKNDKGETKTRGYFERKHLRNAGQRLIDFAKKQRKEMDALIPPRKSR